MPMRITATCFAAKYPESVGCQFNRTWDHSKPIQCIRCIKGAFRHIINMFGTNKEHIKNSTAKWLQNNSLQNIQSVWVFQLYSTWDHFKHVQCIRCVKKAFGHIIHMFGTKKEHIKHFNSETLQNHCRLIRCKISTRCGFVNYIAHGTILSLPSGVRCVTGTFRHIINMFVTENEQVKHFSTETLQNHCWLNRCRVSSQCRFVNFKVYRSFLGLSRAYDALREPSGILLACPGQRMSTLKISTLPCHSYMQQNRCR